jgi:hypothetical protein
MLILDATMQCSRIVCSQTNNKNHLLDKSLVHTDVKSSYLHSFNGNIYCLISIFE